MKLNQLIESKWFTRFFFCFSFAILFSVSDHYFGWTNFKSKDAGMVRSDAAGYYGYMPQWFIYKTKNFEFIDSIAKAYPNDGFEDNFGRTNEGTHTNKYFCGTAIMSSPFFLVGHAHAKIYGAKEDGYSWPYLLWVNIGALVYGLLGIFGIYRIGTYWKFNRSGIYLTLIAILFGTNLFYYTTIDIPYSHVYCFALNSWMIYSMLRWKDNLKSSWKWLFFIILGLGIINRPTNVLTVVFLPFLWDNWSSFWHWLIQLVKGYWKCTLLGILLVLAIIGLQVYNVYVQYGLIQFNVYTNEGFDHWKSPFIWSSLFGFNKGMFIYSPILLLIFPGCYFLYKWSKYRLLGFVISFGLIVYVISSWWCWWYGGAFGLRALVDYYALFALPILVLLGRTKPLVRWISIPFIGMTLFLYQTFDTQYKRNIIIYDGMDYNKFKLVFMQTEPRYMWLLFRDIDTLTSNFKVMGTETEFYNPILKSNGSTFSFKDKMAYELPTITLHFTPEQRKSIEMFAYKFDGQVFAFSDDIYLSLITRGYFNDGQVFEIDNPYGHVPSKIKQWCPVTCDVVSDWKIKDLDSVKITFNYTAKYSDIKLNKITWGTDHQAAEN